MVNRTALRRAFVAATIAWALVLPLATWAAGRPHASNAPYVFALAVYGLASAVCHQLPPRSFYLWSTKMPVCARCAGIYGGGALAAALAPLASRLRTAQPALRVALMASAAPTAATLLFEWTTGVMPAGWVRALAGAPMGAAIVWTVLSTARPEVN